MKLWFERLLGVGMIALDTLTAVAVLPGAWATAAVLAVAVGVLAWPVVEVLA